MTAFDPNLVSIIETAAEAAVQRSILGTISASYLTGTVTDVDFDTFIHSVQMDGDTSAIPVHDITHLGVNVGERVTVLFAPPHQAMIIGQPIHDTWNLVGTAGNPSFNTGWGNNGTTGDLDSGTDPKCMFRRFGNWVEHRGTPVRTSGASNVLFNIPEGYRPRNDTYVVGLNGLTGAEELVAENATGNLVHPAGGNGPFFYQFAYSVA